MIYDINGRPLTAENTFFENIQLDYDFDNPSGTFYTAIRVFKKRTDGRYQYPFTRQPTSTGTMSAYDLASSEGWYLTINGGIGQGLVIQNSTVLVDTAAAVHVGAMPLTIDSNGDLGYVEADTTGKGADIVASGVVSAVCGFFPIIVDYEDFAYPTDIPGTDTESWNHAQRQIIGQFDNGDYCIITGEGRNFAGSVGFSITEAQTVCKNLGLKFAYNLDGGGSTQTVLGTKNINHVYEGTTGRNIECYIVFNGLNTYSIPNA